MARVYVVEALMPRGGTFMAYHIGLILHLEFGYELVNVQLTEYVWPRLFEYDVLPPSMSREMMEQIITEDDILVVNPSFSRYMFGLRLPGRKVCYVQDFRTFSALDCHLDLYVSSSTVVREFLVGVYGMTSPMIPPFIQYERLPRVAAWSDRTPGSVIMYVKEGDGNRATADFLVQRMEPIIPAPNLKVISSFGRSHHELMQEIGGVRFLINVSLAEGFGLVPLEAMAMGTFVGGCDGIAGRDYMRYGYNSMTCSGRDITRIPHIIANMMKDDQYAATIASNGAKDACRYSHESFRGSWSHILKTYLG